ncbi:MAG: hypothetical protein EBR35_05100 [Flavobacteriales bacterium]|nr:hypothetical protein [Flavobacteriales bacterium]NDA98439.1 hypothetical protein [Flavobacteriia bacterium]NDC28441.1 hypothetical protein [Crocinitomicaceae bacterium]NDC92810.1 hypothetical protein [Flavobacteriales bacterium]
MKFTVLLFFLVFIFSCKTQKNNQRCILRQKKLTDTTLKATLVNYSSYLLKKENGSDPIKILDAKIIKNQLILSVSYSGGCEKHNFKITGDSSISKSLPPIRSVDLFHFANGDACKKLIIEELIIDLSELAYKQEEGSEIHLSLNGWDQKISYVFKK